MGSVLLQKDDLGTSLGFLIHFFNLYTTVENNGRHERNKLMMGLLGFATMQSRSNVVIYFTLRQEEGAKTLLF